MKIEKFGRLTPQKLVRTANSHRFWLCLCDCGKSKVIREDGLRTGFVVSCGCFHKEQARLQNKKHGQYGSKTYGSWHAMKQRCSNKNNYKYRLYGGSGIAVCDRWMKFENFYEDMGEKPIGMTLERIDGNKGYAKDNCRWATPREQANNMRTNVFITFNGLKLTASEWARNTGIHKNTIAYRVAAGWSLERALTK